MSDTQNVPVDATAEQAEAILVAAIKWGWEQDRTVSAIMTRTEWELISALDAYGDKWKGLSGPMSESKNTALIAEGTGWVHTLEYDDDVMADLLCRLVNALEAADANNAERDRAVAELVWDACVAAMQNEDGTPVEIISNGNPYRREQR